MLSSFAVMHSLLWSQSSQIINLTHSADKSCQIPGENLSGMFVQGFAAGLLWPPDAWVINEAGESWVWPHAHLWGQGVRDKLLGRGLLAVQENTLWAL